MHSVPFYWKARKAWYINLEVDGKKTKRKLGNTKAEAFERYRTDFAQTSARDPAFLEIAEKWLKFNKKRYDQKQCSGLWLKRITGTIKRFITAHAGIRSSEVTPGLLYEWLEGRKPGYERTELATVKQCIRWAYEAGHLSNNPLEFLKLPTGKHETRDRVLTLADHRQLCRHASPALKRLLRVAWFTGSRPGELRGLKWSDLDAAGGRAVLDAHKTARKTGKPRVIYFPARVRRMLELLPRESEFVFLNTHGRPWTKDALVCAFRRLRKASKLQAVAYDYRHTWITRALMEGVDIATVAELAGHSDTAMVAKVYSHLDKQREHLSNAVDRVGA